LRSFMEQLDPLWLGLSLTMPLKEEAARFANSLDAAAELTGAVNTLVRTEAGWAGYNTDVFGIVQAVRLAGVEAPKTVLILGSGATATSAVTAVKELSPNATVLVHARNAETRGQLVAYAKELGLKAHSVRFLTRAASRANLTIATLPGGALNAVAEKLAKKNFRPNGAILDVAYDPWPSKIASVWSRADQTIISGLEMLLWQAVAQIRIFKTGDPTLQLPNEVAVVEAMRHALE
ncbi:MAG: shikimate dehydrogenase, partial [Actinomycetales bacterium]|nr:shikimate dehydrogenase [Actinomycetales bacterium]